MRAVAFRLAARIATGAAGLGIVVLAALPALAAARGSAGGAPGPGHRPDRYNTGATHSPQVLRQLAGGVTRGGRRAGPLPGALQGVDISSHQHPGGAVISWAKVAAAGIQFAAVKVTEGDYYRNPYALQDLANAKAAGLSVVAYAFAIPNGNGSSASPVVQADYLLAYLAKAGGAPPTIELDLEYNPYGAECYGLGRTAMVSWITQFNARVRAKTGQEPIIYTPPPWWQKCTGGASGFRQLPLWVPDVNSKSSPILPAGWASWAFWQYSSTGTVSGIPAAGNTDLDQLNPARIPLLNPGFQHDAAGSTVRLQVAPADPVAGQALSFSATGLPPGTSIGASGLITGSPGTAGTYHVTVRATSKGTSGSVSFGWTVTSDR